MKPEDLEELKRHLRVISEEIRSEVRLAVETLDGKIESVHREVGALREEMTRGFAETQAMIKFSYAELDRRISALESAFAQLDSRLTKLEKPSRAN